MKLAALLPFMDNEELTKLAHDIIEGKNDSINLTIVFPFLKKAELDGIVDQMIEKGKTKELYSALPFISKETLKKIHDAYKQGKLENFKEEALLPFLDKDTIKSLFDDLVNKQKESD
jgi:ribosomal protein L17